MRSVVFQKISLDPEKFVQFHWNLPKKKVTELTHSKSTYQRKCLVGRLSTVHLSSHALRLPTSIFTEDPALALYLNAFCILVASSIANMKSLRLSWIWLLSIVLVTDCLKVQKIVSSSVAAWCLSCATSGTVALASQGLVAVDIHERPPPATARQRMIRASENILTNPVLENMRKADQLDPDEQAEPQATKALYLVPILSINADIQSIGESIEEISKMSSKSEVDLRLRSILEVLNKEVYETVAFKKIFNKYADNIYYSDPREANLYLGGGTTPTSKQTTQYLLRNDLLTSIGNIKGDVSAMQKEGVTGEMVLEDALDDIKEAQRSMEQYLEMADKEDVDVAKKLYDNRRR